MKGIPLRIQMACWILLFSVLLFTGIRTYVSPEAAAAKLATFERLSLIWFLSGLVLLKICHSQRRRLFFLEGSLDALEMPVTTTDLKMRWVFVNKLTETLLAQQQLNKKTVLGKHCSNWKADICGTENCGVHSLRKGRPRTHYNQEHPDGSTTYMQVDTTYIHDDSGRRIGHVEVVTNIETTKQLSNTVEILTPSSKNLSEVSSGMSRYVGEISNKAETVSVSSEEMSANMASAAASMEQTSGNMEMMAAAMEEMTATINEIANNTGKARTITGEAVSQTSRASSQMDKLGNSVEQITKVVETITEISEQTNLLALNATIEAARAGEAGKGFAVVANEIKELASQTSEGTGAIKKQVEEIQTATKGTLSEIGNISGVVNDIDQIVSSIATAVEEQSVTAKEITANVAQASTGINEINENVAASATVSTEISNDISIINGEISEISTSSSNLSDSAEELSNLAVKLSGLLT